MKADSQAFAHLDSGGLLIVETRELAWAIRRAYDRQQRQTGKTAWPSVRVFTLDDWLAALWKDWRAKTGDPRVLRSDAQTQRVLEQIIARDSTYPLLNLQSTTHAVLRSWRRLHDWELQPGPSLSTTAEDESFRRWSKTLAVDQRRAGWIDRALLPALIAADPPRSLSVERIALLGFDPEPPAMRRLLLAASEAGARVDRLIQEPVPAVDRLQFQAASADDEWGAAARWARNRIDADPEAQVVIIVPDLTERRHAVRSAFDRVLDPARLLPGCRQQFPVYSMIGGTPLSAHAVVDSAMRLLMCGAATLAWSDVGQLLRSPYLPGWDEESGARALLDRQLRRGGRMTWTVSELRARARKSAAGRWAESIGAVTRELAPVAMRAAPSVWSQRVSRALRAAGWADGRTLSSAEFQAADRLRELVAEFATWDSLLPPLEFESARRELERLARETGYQPEGGDPRVRVLDTLDHPGPGCDGLWISGFSADRWPRPGDPDPFLPVAEQRAAGMPWASAELQLQSAQRAVARLEHAAQTVVWSWPQQADDAKLEPSALRPNGLSELRPGDNPPTVSQAIFRASRTEIVEDRGPPIAAGTTQLRGGARVLELQAKCPFRALAELRLDAIRLESPRPGVGPVVRGQLAHRALEILWQGLQSQSGLRALSEAQRKAAAAVAVSAAGAECVATVPAALLRIELDWLERAIAALLEMELKRAPFTVRELEVTERLPIGGVALEFRIDRIDALEAAAGRGEFIIDYKTGRPRSPRWLGDQRDMPQLPAYAITRSETLAGLALGYVNTREPGFRGVAERDEARSAIHESRALKAQVASPSGFEELLANWRVWTTQLVTEHVAGESRVHPLSPATCRECALAALCRIGSDWPSEDEVPDEDEVDHGD